MATTTFIDPGYIDDGYYEAGGGSANQHITGFGECRRGRLPDDWAEVWGVTSTGRINTTGSQSRVEGYSVDMHGRNVLRVQGGVLGVNTGLLWQLLDTESKDVEIRCRFRFLSAWTAGRALFIVRASGALGAESYYGAAFDLVGGNVSINKSVAGVVSSIASASKFVISGGWYLARFRVEGSGLQLKIWEDGTAEPAGYNVTVPVDGSISTGGFGLLTVSSTEIVEIAYYSVGTGGELALDESNLPEPFDSWIHKPDEHVEATARFEYYNPNSNAVETFWASSLGRVTGPSDYPPNTVMYPILQDPGAVTHGLNADAFLAGARNLSFDPVKLNNRPLKPGVGGRLNNWPSYSFSGRLVELRLGKRWAIKPSRNTDGVLSTHRSFEIVTCAVPASEPTVDSQSGTVDLATIDKVLVANVLSRNNVGIPTGIKAVTGSGWLKIPDNGAYDLTSFNIYLRVLVPLAGVPGSTFCTISRRGINSTHYQWNLVLHHASHATVPNRLQLMVYTAAGALLISTSPTLLVNLGRYIDVIISVNGNLRWYMYVDGQASGSGTLSNAPVDGTGAFAEILTDTSAGVAVCDHRIEQWVDETTALARFSARRDPDNLTVSMHRCDDGSGSTVTDYATLANHGTLQGVNVTDRVWVLTYLGAANLAGTPMPISGGCVFHLPPQTIDPVNNGYRFSDRAETVGATVQVRAKGVVLTPVTNYAEPADGPGTIDIVGAVSEPVTIQLLNPAATDDAHTHVPQLVRDELLARGSIDYSTADLTSFDALRKLLPVRGGFFYAQPPTVDGFLSDQLSPLGANYGEDRSGRISAGCLLPPINPGPYGQDKLLEFSGAPNAGVTFGPQSSYDLKQLATYSITAIFKTSALLIDKSVGSSFTYFPDGMTIIDRVNGATGYYLGIDGRDGKLIFGAPGATGTVTGFHYLKSTYNLLPNTWYGVHGIETVGGRSISVIEIDGNGVKATANESINSAMTAPTGVPLKIGHGARGSFSGCILYAIGSSGTHSINWFASMSVSAPVYGSETGVMPYLPVERFWIELRDGSGDVAADRATSTNGRIYGCRWCPRIVMDFTKRGTPMWSGVKRGKPAWRSDAKYNRNYSVINGTNVDVAVSAADRAAIGEEFISNPTGDATVQSNYRDSLDPSLLTPLVVASDAEWIRRLVVGRLSVARRYGNAGAWYREGLKLGKGDEVYIKGLFGFEAGRSMRVFNLVQRLGMLTIDADVWG